MLSEAYRVLAPRGRIGVSVWGRKEKSDYFSIIVEVLEEKNISSDLNLGFELGEREDLIDLLKK